MKDYSKLLTDFYLKYNPDKVSEVNYLLTKYKGQEEVLLKKLYEKYKIIQEKDDDGTPSEKNIIEKQPAENITVSETPADVIQEKELYQETKPQEEIHTEVMPETDIPQDIKPMEMISPEVMPETDQPQEIISGKEVAAFVLKDEEQPYELNHEDEIHSEEKLNQELPPEQILDLEIPVEEVSANDQAKEIKTEAVKPDPVKPEEIYKESGDPDATPKDFRELLITKPVPETSSVMYKTPPQKSKKRLFLPLIIILLLIALGLLSLRYFLYIPKVVENNKASVKSNEIQVTPIYNDTLKENNPVTEVIPDSTGLTVNSNQDTVAPEKLSQNHVEYVPAEGRTKDSSVIHETAIPAADDLKDLIIYRIQMFTSKKQRPQDQIVIEGKSYSTYEYLYNDIYCYAIGEFKSGHPATEFKNICRKNGYPDAFVVTIKNRERIP